MPSTDAQAREVSLSRASFFCNRRDTVPSRHEPTPAIQPHGRDAEILLQLRVNTSSTLDAHYTVRLICASARWWSQPLNSSPVACCRLRASSSPRRHLRSFRYRSSHGGIHRYLGCSSRDHKVRVFPKTRRGCHAWLTRKFTVLSRKTRYRQSCAVPSAAN